MMTCSICPALTPAFCSAHLMAIEPSFGALRDDKVPRNEPIGVRAPPRMTISFMVPPWNALPTNSRRPCRLPAASSTPDIIPLNVKPGVFHARLVNHRSPNPHSAVRGSSGALPAHAGRRLRHRHGPSQVERLLGLRFAAGPSYPRFLLQFCLLSDRLQPSAAGDGRVQGENPRSGHQQAGKLGHLHHPHGRVCRDVCAPGRSSLPQQTYVLHRGRLPRDRERRQDRLRLEGEEELPQGIHSGARQPDHAPQGSLPRAHRLHPLHDQYQRPQKDSVFPEVRLASSAESEDPLPGHRRIAARDSEAGDRDSGSGQGLPAGAEGRHRRFHHGAHPGRGGRQSLPSRILSRHPPALR